METWTEFLDPGFGLGPSPRCGGNLGSKVVDRSSLWISLSNNKKREFMNEHCAFYDECLKKQTLLDRMLKIQGQVQEKSKIQAANSFKFYDH